MYRSSEADPDLLTVFKHRHGVKYVNTLNINNAH